MSRIKVTTVVTAVLLAVGLSGCNAVSSTPPFSIVMTATYDLTGQQHTELDSAARTGFAGLEGFKLWIWDPEYAKVRLDWGEPLGPVPAPVPLGGTFVKNDSLSLDSALAESGFAPRYDGRGMQADYGFTPTVSGGGSYVTYHSTFRNLYADSTETTVLGNTETMLFDEGKPVTVDDMLKFFNDPNTYLVSVDNNDKGAADGGCAVKLSFSGNTLATNAAADCSHYVRDATIDGLVKDLVYQVGF